MSEHVIVEEEGVLICLCPAGWWIKAEDTCSEFSEHYPVWLEWKMKKVVNSLEDTEELTQALERWLPSSGPSVWDL